VALVDEAIYAAREGLSLAEAPIPRLEDRSLALDRPDGWLRRVSLPRPKGQAGPQLAAAEPQPQTAPPPGGGLVRVASLPRGPLPPATDAVPAAAADAPPPQAASPAEPAAEPEDEDGDEVDEPEAPPAQDPGTGEPAVTPEPTSQVVPDPDPARGPDPLPSPSPPLPTPPVIPANAPPVISSLRCSPEEVEEAGTAVCEVVVEDDGGLEGLTYSWEARTEDGGFVGGEFEDPAAAVGVYAINGTGSGLGWQGRVIIVITVRDAEGEATIEQTTVQVTPARALARP
jgi:hypothetical protein